MLLALILTAAQAFATPAPDLAALVAKAYDPHVSFVPYREEKLSPGGCSNGRNFIEAKGAWSQQPRTIELNEYRGKLGPTQRAVIIMPPTGGETWLDQQWGNALCQAGLRAVIVRSFEMIADDDDFNPRMYDHEALEALVAIRQVTDYLQRTGSTSIGIMGTSLGALQASFAVAVDSRLNTAAFIAGGLGLAQIAAYSNEPAQKKLREIRMPAWHMNQEQYAEALRRAVHIDVVPYVSPALAQTKKVYQVIATEDSYVPTANQWRLYHAFGDQQKLEIKHDHVEAIIRNVFQHKTPLVQFFDQNLK